MYLCGFNVPLLKQYPLGSFKHDLLVTSVSLKLVRKYDCSYTTDREFRHEKGLAGVGNKGHSPDSVLHMDDKDYAIEIEINTKARARLDKIMKHYLQELFFVQVLVQTLFQQIA